MVVTEFLVNMPDALVYTYGSIYREIMIGDRLAQLLTHVVFWADPVWIQPYRSSTEAKQNYNFQDVVSETYVPLVFDDDDVPSNVPRQIAAAEKVQTFISQLRTYIRGKQTFKSAVDENDHFDSMLRCNKSLAYTDFAPLLNISGWASPSAKSRS